MSDYTAVWVRGTTDAALWVMTDVGSMLVGCGGWDRMSTLGLDACKARVVASCTLMPCCHQAAQDAPACVLDVFDEVDDVRARTTILTALACAGVDVPEGMRT